MIVSRYQLGVGLESAYPRRHEEIGRFSVFPRCAGGLVRRLRLLTGGESHGPGLTAILEGLPAGLELDRQQIDTCLQRRQHGFGRGGRQKIEKDEDSK